MGNPSAQPNLSLVFPSAETGARDQSFRLIVKPEFWGAKSRMRFSNALGTQPVTFDGAFVGLQWSGSAVMPGTNRPITFGGKNSVTVAPGESVWSDAVTLPFVTKGKRIARPQAGGEFPCCRLQRPDDLACQGHAVVLRHFAGRRFKRR